MEKIQTRSNTLSIKSSLLFNLYRIYRANCPQYFIPKSCIWKSAAKIGDLNLSIISFKGGKPYESNQYFFHPPLHENMTSVLLLLFLGRC